MPVTIEDQHGADETFTISELVAELERLRAEHGDLPVCIRYDGVITVTVDANTMEVGPIQTWGDLAEGEPVLWLAHIGG